jgi:hypothetical protein
MSQQSAVPGWGHVERCDAVDPAGNRCALQAGHPGSHRPATAAPRHELLVIVVSLLVLGAAELVNLILGVAAYYGLGGANKTPEPPWLELILSAHIVLLIGVVFVLLRRWRAAIACAAAVLLLDVPAGLVAEMTHGTVTGVMAYGTTALLFAIPGLLLLGLVGVARHLYGGAPATGARNFSPVEPPFDGPGHRA